MRTRSQTCCRHCLWCGGWWSEGDTVENTDRRLLLLTGLHDFWMLSVSYWASKC